MPDNIRGTMVRPGRCRSARSLHDMGPTASDGFDLRLQACEHHAGGGVQALGRRRGATRLVRPSGVDRGGRD